MVLSLSAFAQNDLAMQASGARAETDRSWYLAGEAMKVSITADDALIAYAELCDMNGLAAGVVVGLKEGKGEGTIELPSDLHSGYYMLSVYTRDNANVSQQLVAVINPLRRSVDDDIEWVEVTTPLSSIPSVASNDSSNASPEGTSDNNSSASPEGNTNVLLQGNEASSRTVRGAAVHETEGHIIQARIRNVYDGNTYRGSQICPSISIVGKQIHYFEGQMVNDSTAVFYTYGIQGKQPLVLSALTSTGVSLPIELISPFAILLPKELPHLVFHYNRNEVEARSLDIQRHQILKGSEENQATVVPLDYDETVFGTQPDLSYNLDEYRQFSTIREVLIEYVSCVKNTRINGVQRLIVRREQDQYNSTLPTLVLIDGMPVFDIERLLNYDARRVHYINIYSNQYTLGNGLYNGILSIVTRSGQLTNYATEPNMQYLVYDFPE